MSKNQNKCWNATGSPPESAANFIKPEYPNCRSKKKINNTVIPAPKTGRVVINNIDTKNIEQIIKSQFKLLIPEFRLNWRLLKGDHTKHLKM